jgi:phospholipase/lecithinase/hemolysin
MRSLFAILLLAMLLSYPPQSTAQPFSQVIVFGDSNVDAGYYKKLASPGGGATYDSLWPSAVQHGAGAPTTSPGLVYPGYLAAYFGLTANPSNATGGGTNYATSGAKNVIPNNSGNGGFTAAIPTHNQMSNYLSAHGGVADSQALYVIHSGDNDVTYAAGESGAGPYPADPSSYVMEAAEDLGGDILILKNAGAQHIIVAGLEYNFGDANRKALKLLYTQTLFQNLTQLGIPYYPADTDKVRSAISANPANYGFTSISTATVACTQPAGVTSAWALLCSEKADGGPSSFTPPAQLTDLFADDGHLAYAGQLLMARFFRNLVVPWTVTHDFNGAGKSSIAWLDTNNNAAVWIMNGAQLSQSAGLGAAAAGWALVGQRDFDSDGKADWLWQNSSGAVAIWFMNGTQVSSSQGVGNAGGTWAIVGTGDFDGNGKGDILWRDNSGNVAVWLMNGVQVITSAGLGAAPSGWSIVGTGDFNADGKTDILWYNNGNVAIWQMNGAQVIQSVGIGSVPPVWTVAGTGDFNGDGTTDILWIDNSGNVAVWLMQLNQLLQSAGVGAAASGWSIVETGDFNGDGKSDILWRDNSGNVAIWFMNGTQVSSSAGVGNVPTIWLIQGAGAD